MTIKDLAEMLTEQGYDIKLRKRADGGYLISRINGVSYKGASGNIKARTIVGADISHARKIQLARIRPPKKVAPAQRKLSKVPEELVKEMRKVQREWRKTHKDIAGTISMKGLRYQYETYGEEMTRASLNKAYRYTQGYAYLENVEHLLERIQLDLYKVAEYFEEASLNKIIAKIKQKSLSFREDWIHEIYDELYEFEKGFITAQELERRIDGIMM